MNQILKDKNTQERLMRRAIQLARLGDGATSPNPLVGAIVLNSNGILVGEGYHTKAGNWHAEVEAINRAGDRAKGGTIVVTLEPCCHTGRTPPCTDAIIRSGIVNVIIGSKDSDERVAGKGIKRLKEAGLNVIFGVAEKEALNLNKEFFFRIKHNRSWGILKCAVSLDGRISLPNGESKWISSEESRKLVHSLRAKCDAVIVGTKTVKKDNPLLTSRGLKTPEPTRVILTNSFNFSEKSQIFDTNIAKTIIAYGPEIDLKKLKKFDFGPELMPMTSTEPITLSKNLAKKGFNRVLWECGPRLSTIALKQNCIQELLIVIAPKILGGNSSMTLFEDFGFNKLDEVFSFKNFSCKEIGGDYHFSAFLDEI